MIEFVAAQLQKSAQNILKHKRPVIPDVRVVIDRRATRIHPHFALALRCKRLRLPAQRVMKPYLRHQSPPIVQASACPSFDGTAPTHATTEIASAQTAGPPKQL